MPKYLGGIFEFDQPFCPHSNSYQWSILTDVFKKTASLILSCSVCKKRLVVPPEQWRVKLHFNSGHKPKKKKTITSTSVPNGTLNRPSYD